MKSCEAGVFNSGVKDLSAAVWHLKIDMNYADGEWWSEVSFSLEKWGFSHVWSGSPFLSSSSSDTTVQRWWMSVFVFRSPTHQTSPNVDAVVPFLCILSHQTLNGVTTISHCHFSSCSCAAIKKNILWMFSKCRGGLGFSSRTPSSSKLSSKEKKNNVKVRRERTT